jgi:hypothetical protein
VRNFSSGTLFRKRKSFTQDTDRLPTTEETNNDKVRKVAVTSSATTTITVALLSTKSSFTNDEHSF